ncbi:hypothetical protein HY251_09385, partial [bacterium]|nr:hypothetical protein [bacterium]
MGHTVLAFDPKRAETYTGQIELCSETDLKSGGTGADWIAIAPRSLAKGVEPLAAHRAKQGLKTKIVFLEDIEDAFNDGTFGPEAIRAFLAYAKKNWTPAPRFVLLVGDAFRDARPDDGPWVPTSLVDTYDNGGSASDYDLTPAGVAIGRFPVRNVSELQSLVEKTIAYETAPEGEWQKQLAFVTGEGHFGPMIDRAIEDLFARAISKRVPDAFDVDVTYANPTSIFLYPPDEFSKRVVERLSEGPLIFDYIGHGSQHNVDTVHWGTRRFPILRREDAAKVSGEKGRHPIALITACWTGAFDEPEPTVGEALLLNPRGAVAVFAASRVSHPFANALLSLELTRRLFEKAGEVEPDARPRLGERLRGALDDLSLESGGAEGKTVRTFAGTMLNEAGLMERLIEDERHLYNLLGDPALVVRYPRSRKVVAPAKAQAGETIDVSLEGDAGDLQVTLERGRALRKDLEGLADGT